jgi:hypothetical protein
MNPELREFIEQARFCRASVQRVAELLPPEDAELDALIAEIARENNPKAFLHVMVAALGQGRRVEARHLARGATLLGHPLWLGSVMFKVQGDVPEQMMAAIENSQLPFPVEAGALLAMQDWCREFRGGKLPETFFPIARRLARHDDLPTETRGYLTAVALRTNDAGLLALVRGWYPKAKPDKLAAVEKAAVVVGDGFLQACRLPILEMVGVRDNKLAHGATMRRAVARVGRNEPCPCGSGRKYKHCCLEKDNERLHHSSGVAGVTVEELLANLDTHMTAAILNRTQTPEMLKLDPSKIPADLRIVYFMRLAAFQLFDRAVEAFQKIGFADEIMVNIWINVMFLACRAGRKEIIKQLLDVRKESTQELDTQIEIPLGAALLLESDDPARVLQLMDEAARDVLDTENPRHMKQMAHGLLFSPHRALGILAARGMIPLLPSGEAVGILDSILEARDVLNLPPDDPISEIVDQRNAEHEEDDAKLREARQTLDAKAEEVRGLKEKLEGLQMEIARREKKTAADAAAKLEEAPLKELRRKVEELKSALTERHGERNQLRRELQKAHDGLETLQQKAAASPEEEAGAARDEEQLLLPQDAPEVHPVRLADYPKQFLQTLGHFPRHVARAAVIMIGRLSAGEPAAFVGALRLKATPNVMRQRIGINYRLLFRLWPERLEVIDLINRKDLDRRIKTLV